MKSTFSSECNTENVLAFKCLCSGFKQPSFLGRFLQELRQD